MSCSSSRKIKDGRTAYDLKQYAIAIPLFEKEYAKVSASDAKANIASLLGDCHLILLQYKEALDYFTLAEQSGSAKIDARLKKAYVLKNMMRYDEAIPLFESLASTIALTAEAHQQALICRSFKNGQAPLNLSIEVFQETQNYSDYSVLPYLGNSLVITSDRRYESGDESYGWTGRAYSDLFIVDKKNGEARPFDQIINSEHNEGTVAFTQDFNTIIFTRCYNLPNEKDETCKLMNSKNVDGTWSESVYLPFQQANINYGHPCLIANDSVLIFASKADVDSKGYDLWYAEWNGSSWTDPYPLPSSINTEANEYFPTSDGDTLYFSSDNKRGYGGLDIYKTWLDAQNKWHQPQLLAYPINTGADDFSYIVDRGSPNKIGIQLEGYFSSSRALKGNDQIYYFKYLGEKKKEKDEIIKDSMPKSSNIILYLAVKAVTPVFENNDPNQQKTGKQALRNTTVTLISDGKEILKQKTDRNGLVLSIIPMDKEFTLYAVKDSFLNAELSFSSKNIAIPSGEETLTINKEVSLEKIYKGKEIVLENIYYDYDKWDIKEDAKPTLDRLASILKSNPNINIELGSHTDCRGEEAYNIDLSSKRAQAAQAYLISKGILTTRITTQGYGENSPAVYCECIDCTEAQHQVNRRTTFKIL